MKVLFVTYGGGHVEMCLPVMRALRATVPGCDVRIMALTTAYGMAVAAGEEPLGFRDFCDMPDAKRALHYGAQLLPLQTHPAVDAAESVAYLGFNFLDWVKQEGEEWAWQQWKNCGRYGFLPVQFFCDAFERLKPDVVVTTNSPRSEYAAVLAAASRHIPSVSMVDLFSQPHEPFSKRLVHADRITVLCEATRTNLLASGVSDERIEVTGNPAFDTFTGTQAEEAGAHWRLQHGWENLHVVLWAGHREHDDVDRAWAGTALGSAVQAMLIRWIDEHPQAALIVRYHPNEWHEFERPARHPRVHWSQPDQESLLPVLAAADDVVVQGSTTGVQASMAGKRVISLGFSPFVQQSGMNLAALGLAVDVRHMEEMRLVLDRGLAASEARRVRDSSLPVSGSTADCGEPGQASAAVAQIICGLAAAKEIRIGEAS